LPATWALFCPGLVFRNAARRNKEASCPLIFDEVITGFDWPKRSSRVFWNRSGSHLLVSARRGFPLALIGGKKNPRLFSASWRGVSSRDPSGNSVAVASGLAALNAVEREGFYQELEKKTNLLIEPIRRQLQKRESNACIQQFGSMVLYFLA